MLNKLLCFILISLSLGPASAIAQRLNYDTAYIENHTTDLTLRTFGGYTFAGYKLDQKNFHRALTYKSNDNFNIGIGANYRFLGLNIGFKAPWVNNDYDRFGKTKRLDLQTHIYLRKFTVDLYGQFGKGYYIRNGDIVLATLPSGSIVLRPDLQTRMLGVNAHYIFNNRRLSYRAAFLQNEYQKKSAGSFILGAGIHHFYIRADSAIIPQNVIDQNFFRGSRFNKSRVFCLAANAGFVQTIVIKKHFFITGALIGGIGMNTTSLTDENLKTFNKKTAIQYDGTVRVAAGYNSTRYFAGVQYTNFLTTCPAPFAGSWQEFESGNFRLTLAKRFPIKRNLIKDLYKTLAPGK